MKKILYLTIIFCCVLAMPVVAAMKLNPANDNINQNSKSNLSRPMYATNIKIAKKIPASLEVREIKNLDILSKQYENNDFSEAATGVLSTEVVGNKYAVVIGICDYPGRKNDICLSDGDSYNMYKALTGFYGYEAKNIYWFRDKGGIVDGIDYEKPTRENIEKAIIDIRDNKELGENDEVVFFFSGHGLSGTVIEDNDSDYIDSVDSDGIDEGIVVYDSDGRQDEDRSPKLDYIWDGELRNWFDGFATTRIIFIFDTCRAGGMNDVASEGRIIVMSSEETQYSYVYSYGEFGEGMFSRYFVNEGMLEGLADGYNQLGKEDNVVAVEESFDYAKENIPLRLEGIQTPIISDNFTNDLLLGYHLYPTDN